IWLVFVCCGIASALEPNEILVVANGDIAASVRLAQYYCERRRVPVENILTLPLGMNLADTISRADYEEKLAKPIRERLAEPELADRIRCLLTTYGVPFKVGPRGALSDKKERLEQLTKQKTDLNQKLEQLQKSDAGNNLKEVEDTKRKLNRLQSKIDYITGRETSASVDSELSMVLFGEYQLYRWQPNKLKDNVLGLRFNTLMVSRIDGPDFETAQGLIDKAMAAERTGLNGAAYIDSRGITKDDRPYSFGYFDQSLRDLAVLARFRTELTITQEQTEKLFQPGECPQTAIYCGWYSLEKYVDAFDFVDGAIGYHISSLEAVDLRDANSGQWCPAMLVDGITATLGAVSEPYLHSFPEPKEFFLQLFNGRCLVEAYYYTKPFNSWQLVLVGDPLYTPFKGIKHQ
ncbi:MAG: TIGR03790 family protein, partial [Planctomycetota bacterium]